VRAGAHRRRRGDRLALRDHGARHRLHGAGDDRGDRPDRGHAARPPAPARRPAERMMAPAESTGLGRALAIDAVYVLSVKTFADRIAHVTRELGRHGIAFEFIFAFDAAELDETTMLRHFGRDGPPMYRQASLTLKHLEAWRLADARGARRIMVF